MTARAQQLRLTQRLLLYGSAVYGFGALFLVRLALREPEWLLLVMTALVIGLVVGFAALVWNGWRLEVAENALIPTKTRHFVPAQHAPAADPGADNPFAGPTEPSGSVYHPANPLWLFSNVRGRIPRRVFWGGLIGIQAAQFVVDRLVFLLHSTSFPEDLQLYMFIALFAAKSWCIFILAAKRLHDLGYAAYLAPLASLPCVGIFVIVALGTTRGTVGPNAYGPDPT